MLKSACLVTLSATTIHGAAMIHPELQRSLDSTDATANIIVTIKGGVSRPILNASRVKSLNRGDSISNLAYSLKQHASNSQASVLRQLSSTRSMNEFESFWSANVVFVANASAELVASLAALDNVEEIHQENIVTISPILEDLGDDAADVGVTENGLQWGVERVASKSVWETGNQGQGIIVGSIDTGVRLSHDILKNNWIGAEQNGWFDPYEGTAEPMDDNGHGTHTMGTIAGANGYGVAPGAKWLSCRGCKASGCTERALLACGQYTLCPTDTAGENADCSKAPHVSSNSWGGGKNQPWYQTTVDSWRAANIVPVFAQGNSGQEGCGSANSPGDYANVIGVGATTSTGKLASFSSVGPSVKGLRKPDVSAPGQSVSSAWFDGDSSYQTISGTSMACPHVAGVVALMLSADPTLTYDGIYAALTQSCSVELTSPDQNCGNIQDSQYPNNMFGYGITHAVDAIDSIGATPAPPSPTPAPPSGECFKDWRGACVLEANCWGGAIGSCTEVCYCPTN